jgi:hypothetical protein
VQLEQYFFDKTVRDYAVVCLNPKRGDMFYDMEEVGEIIPKNDRALARDYIVAWANSSRIAPSRAIRLGL